MGVHIGLSLEAVLSPCILWNYIDCSTICSHILHHHNEMSDKHPRLDSKLLSRHRAQMRLRSISALGCSRCELGDLVRQADVGLHQGRSSSWPVERLSHNL